MKISGLYGEKIILESTLILEAGYGRVVRFNYDAFETDSNPIILYLGKWKNRRTGNVVVGGVNLNYLSGEQLTKLRENLRTILRAGRTLKARWRKGHEILPDIFPRKGSARGAYRTYRQDMMHVKSTSTITPIDVKPEPKPEPKVKPSKSIRTPSRTSGKAPSRLEPPGPKKRPEKKQEVPSDEPIDEPEVPTEPEGPVKEPEGPARASEEPDDDSAEAPTRASEEEPEAEPDITVDDVGRAVDLKQKETGVGPKAKEKRKK